MDREGYGCHVSVLVGEKRAKREFIFMQNETICITCVKFICKTPPPNFALKQHGKHAHKRSQESVIHWKNWQLCGNLDSSSIQLPTITYQDFYLAVF